MKKPLSVRRAALAAAAVLLSTACQAPSSPSRTDGPAEPSAVPGGGGASAMAARPTNPATVAFRARCDGLACTFYDRSRCTDPARAWSFGDGTVGVGLPREPLTHTYASTGLYEVTLSTACGVETKTVRVD